MGSRRGRSLAVLMCLGLGLLLSLTALPAAQAVTGSAPVTQPDSAGSVYPGNLTLIAPLANDTDPDGDELAICRLGTESYKGLQVDFQGVDLAVVAGPRVKPGTYTYTYYACDFSYLTPGTITVTVEKLPHVKVHKIDGRPGHLRVTNPAPFKIRFLYGSFKADRPDGNLIVDKDSAVVISVHRTRIDWIATDRKGELFLGTGHVTGIKLGRSEPSPAGQDLSSRLAHLWRAA